MITILALSALTLPVTPVQERGAPSPEAIAGVAAAQAAGDLAAEQVAAKRLLDSMSGSNARAHLAAVMRGLDARRSGAFLSAHLIAGELLVRATSKGDFEFVDGAADVLAQRAHERGGGTQLEALDAYARGLLARSSGSPSDARRPLASAVDLCVDEEWAHLAIHVGTEACINALELEDERTAAKIVKSVASLFDGERFHWPLRRWKGLMLRRIPEAPEKVLTALRRASERYPEDDPRYLPRTGGVGGAGADSHGERRAVPGVWAALAKPREKDVLVHAKRTRRGISVELGFDDAAQATLPFSELGEAFSEAGVVLWCFDHAVALRQLRPNLMDGLPGLAGDRQWTRPWYLLGEGERWELSTTGVVRIKR